MSRYLIFIFFLLNIYTSEKEEEKVSIYEVNPNLGKEKEFNVKVGDQFAIKLICNSNSWVFLNKNEKDSVTFIKADYEAENDDVEYIGLGRRGYLYYYFRANEITKEPKLLKFTDTYSYLKQTNPTPKFVIKINVN